MKRVLVMGAAAVVLAVAMVVLLRGASTHTVIARGAWTYIPFYGDKGIKESINELLWERFGYGPAAIEMIKEHPIDGVGVGVFHALSTDFGKVAGYTIPQAGQRAELVASSPGRAWPRRQHPAARVVLDLAER